MVHGTSRPAPDGDTQGIQRARGSGPGRTRLLFGLLCISLLLPAACSFGRGNATPIAAAQSATATPIPAAPTVTPARGTPITTRASEVASLQHLYTGNVLAEDRVDVAVEVNGRVLALYVEVGENVSTGELLLELDRATLEARQEQALAGLEAASAQLELLLQPATASDLEAANAAVAAAEAAYARAAEGPTEEDLRTAEAQLRQAEAAVSQAQSAYDLVKWQPNIDALPQSLHLQQATLQLEAARAQYEKLIKGATSDILAGAYAQISQARARLTALESGPKDAQIRAAEAQVHQAETVLYLATLELNKATLLAPISGTVIAVHTAVGALAAPGTRAISLQSHAVKVEIPVEEVRLADLSIGQPAVIRVNAWPDRTFPGTVAIIAPALDPVSRTVLVTIRPTGDSADLRPGMFATVELGS